MKNKVVVSVCAVCLLIGSVDFALGGVCSRLDLYIVRDGSYTSFPLGTTVTWAFHDGDGGAFPAELRPAIQNAIQAWGDPAVTTSLNFMQLEDNVEAMGVVVVDDSVVGGGYSNYAGTEPYYSSGVPGAIIGFKVGFHLGVHPIGEWITPNNPYGSIDAEGVALRLIGQAIGLGKPEDEDCDCNYTVMWQDSGCSWLGPVDINAAMALYDATVSMEPEITTYSENSAGERVLSDQLLFCPAGDLDALIVKIVVPAGYNGNGVPFNHITLGDPLEPEVYIVDQYRFAENDLNAGHNWETEIRIEGMGGCGVANMPVFFADEQIGLATVDVRSLDLEETGTSSGVVDLADYGTFGADYGKCDGDAGWNQCADFNFDGCVELGDYSIFGSHYGHSVLNPKSFHQADPIEKPGFATNLRSCYPNPFNPSTTIEFALGKPGHAKLGIYNLDGKLVRELVSSNLGVGNHQYVWNGNDAHGAPVASGVYLYRLVTQDETLTKRMMLLK